MLASPHWWQAYLSQATVHSTTQAHSAEHVTAHEALTLLVPADLSSELLDFKDDLLVLAATVFAITT
jgi:hypothetical protein